MLSNYTAPFQNWEVPQISEIKKFPQLSEKNFKSRKVTQKDLDDIISSSQNYFSHNLNPHKFKLRLPKTRAAKFDDCINPEFLDIR